MHCLLPMCMHLVTFNSEEVAEKNILQQFKYHHFRPLGTCIERAAS